MLADPKNFFSNLCVSQSYFERRYKPVYSIPFHPTPVLGSSVAMSISTLLVSFLSLLAFALLPSTAEAGSTVCSLARDGSKVNRWNGNSWVGIGDAASNIYSAGNGVLATTPINDQVFHYNPSTQNWRLLGSGGAKFVATASAYYRLTSSRNAVERYSFSANSWTNIGGPASNIYGGGDDSFFAVNPGNNEIWQYFSNGNRWSKVGGGGADFAVDGNGVLYGVSTPKDALYQYTGNSDVWTKIGDATSRVFAGRYGVFAVNVGNTEIWEWSRSSNPQWRKVGSGGIDFAVSDEALYGLDTLGTKIYRYDRANGWRELTGAGSVRQIVQC